MTFLRGSQRSSAPAAIESNHQSLTQQIMSFRQGVENKPIADTPFSRVEPARTLPAPEELRSAFDMLARTGTEAFDERAERKLLAVSATLRERHHQAHKELSPQRRKIARRAGDGPSNLDNAHRVDRVRLRSSGIRSAGGHAHDARTRVSSAEIWREPS
jgi:hypothetical protein